MVIGVTGNLGVGKTTVAKMFVDLGAHLIDADAIAHSIIQADAKIYRKIIKVFGKQILSGHYISRKKLSRIAFYDREKLGKLNNIMHPEILSIIQDRIRQYPSEATIVVDAALLIESALYGSGGQLSQGKGSRKINWLPWIDKMVVVKSRRQIQIRRLRNRGLTAEQIRMRLCFQLPQGIKTRLADFLIDNSNGKRHTEKQVRDVWKKIFKDAPPAISKNKGFASN